MDGYILSKEILVRGDKTLFSASVNLEQSKHHVPTVLLPISEKAKNQNTKHIILAHSRQTLRHSNSTKNPYKFTL